ncbi:MAG: thiamine-phosphate kinase [Vicinamibacterales bacterium]
MTTHLLTVSDRTEAELIALVQAHLAAPPDWLVVGIGDDAAVVEPARNRLEVLTVDALVDGVHFDRRFTPPDAIGHRALAVNLSDIASMGAEPRYALLSMALPATLPLVDFDRMAAGFAHLASRHKVHVIGGNLTRTPGPLTIDVTVAGSVKRRDVLRRSGARPGDEVYVSGVIGAAAAGLRALRAGTATPDIAEAVSQYLRPQPRVRLGMLLGRNRAASACMDLSDGLADAAHQVARMSGVGMVVEAGQLPLLPAASARDIVEGWDPVRPAVTGGDDYELLFTVRPRLRRRLQTIARQADVTITRVGVCTADPTVVLHRADHDEPMPRGYGHFQ